MKNTKIQDIMTKDIVTIGLDDRLHKVKDIFDSNNFRHLLVVEDDKLIGIVSDRDLFRNISPNIGKMRYTMADLNTINQPVHMILTRHPITLKPDDNLRQAIHILNTHKISCIPIVNDDNIPVGILSWKDILKNIKLED